MSRPRVKTEELTKQIEGGENPEILSTYEDAAKTYEFTWAIRQSSEESTKKQLAKYGKAV